MSTLKELVERVVEHFLGHDRLSRVALFAEHARQVEGWFKGEMMVALQECQNKGLLRAWWPEVTYKKGGRTKKVDFVVEATDRKLIGIEIKTPFVGKQAKRLLAKPICEDEVGSYGLRAYFGGGDGVPEDARRLREADVLAERICMVFAYGLASYRTSHRQDSFEQEVRKLAENPATALGNAEITEVVKSGIRLPGGNDDTRLYVLAIRVGPQGA